MSNPPPSSAPPASSGGVAASPLPATASMATPSPAPRLSTRKRNVGSAPRLLPDSADLTTPVRRFSRETSRDDPSLMMAGTVELAGGDIVPERAPIPRSSTKVASQGAENLSRRESHPTKPKLLKLSLQATKPSGGMSSLAASRSHLFKNLSLFVAFIIIAGLATTFWSTKAPPPSPFDGISMEGQVAELEEILRKTTKMMQVQLDLVDMKIHKEVEGLRKELEEKIDEQATTFGTELHNLLARTEDIETSLKGLMDAGFPSRQDVSNLINAVVDKRAAEGTGKALSLDDVRAVARYLVEDELDKHAADGIGRVDYALGTGGAKVIDHSEGFYHGLRMGLHQITGSFWPGGSNKHPLANKILEPSFGEPGQCLPLKGSKVHVDIFLRTSVFPDAFSLEHVSKSVAYDVSSAPKEFQVLGWLESYKKDDTALKSMTHVLLGNFVYDIDNKKNVQTFQVPQDVRGKLVNMVRLDVLSNHGSPSHTCLYRFRVHGLDASKAGLPSPRA